MQLGASRDHIAHGLVIPGDLRLRLARRSVPPQPHPTPTPVARYSLSHRAARRVRAVDLGDRLVTHGAIEPAAGRPHKKRRGTAAGAPRRYVRARSAPWEPAHGYRPEGSASTPPPAGAAPTPRYQLCTLRAEPSAACGRSTIRRFKQVRPGQPRLRSNRQPTSRSASAAA